MKHLSLDNFIERAVNIHGNCYDYNKTIYNGYKNKVIIICKIHGEFLQSPNDHLSGKGCKKCAGFKVFNTLDFINESKLIHNNYYDYEDSIYVDSRSKVSIKCPKHGIFKQFPNDHLSGKGCKKCGYESSANKNSLTTNEFIIKANLIHNNMYDYSKTNYISQKHKIVIICLKCGEFIMTPNNHLCGKGCPICAINKSARKRSLDLLEFISKSNIIHHNKYDYSKSNYINNIKTIIIKCPKHGEFSQRPHNHLNGKGCPSCSHCISKMETSWINSFNNLNIKRHYPITIGSKIINVDGFDPNTNTIYEFYGDFWHGNPKKFISTQINTANKKTFGDLYLSTIERENCIKQSGYKIISIWENDYILQKNLLK